MILTGIFNSIEFYVVATVIAAAVVALCVRPSSKGEALTYFVPGQLSLEGGEEEPTIDIDVRDDGVVVVTRRGFEGLSADSRVTLAITQIQFDLSIEERIADIPCFERADTARFHLDSLGREHYHLTYRAEHSGLFCSATFPVRSGIHVRRVLAL